MVPEVGISRRFCWLLDREGSMHVQNAVFFVEREEEDEKERADSSRGKQQRRADSSG